MRFILKLNICKLCRKPIVEGNFSSLLLFKLSCSRYTKFPILFGISVSRLLLKSSFLKNLIKHSDSVKIFRLLLLTFNIYKSDKDIIVTGSSSSKLFSR